MSPEETAVVEAAEALERALNPEGDVIEAEVLLPTCGQKPEPIYRIKPEDES